MPSFNIAFLMTGSELMSGDIIESNSAEMARQLATIGLSVKERVVIGDDKLQLKDTISRLSCNFDMLIINGGLGPTSDDLTAEILSDISQQPLLEHKEATHHIIQWCQHRGTEANLANLKQALLPQNARIFPHAPGSASAFYLYINDCLVIATPGVPSELNHILRHQLLDFLQKKLPCESEEQWQRYSLLGIGESQLQQVIHDHFPELIQFFDIGYRATLPCLEFKLKRKKNSQFDQQKRLESSILNYLSPFLINEGNNSLVENIVKLLQEEKKSLSCAESCTGGLISSEITKVTGSSSVFYGAIVSYSNALKENLLHVKSSTLNQYGAVSQEVSIAMLKGALNQCRSDYAIAVTGIAGPEGGSEEKPAGTVWIAYGNKYKYDSIGLLLPFKRHDFQMMVTIIALDLIRREVLNIEGKQHLKRWMIT